MYQLNSNSKLLITGGTGSFGKAFIADILKCFPKIKKIIIFSRDELKQWELQCLYPEEKFPQLKFILGDIRDKERLKIALIDVDTVIHAAALKHVVAAEYNPYEYIKTNILGGQNIIEASLEMNVKNIIALSTDKASCPVNLYGATKFCSDKLFIAANSISSKNDLKISVVRYGNVLGSRGSVIPFFIELAKTGRLPITDPNMTRFNITLQESVDIVKWALNNAYGGEIVVPKLSSYRILELADAIGPDCEKIPIGIRPGEKIHEEMISVHDSSRTYDIGDYYLIFTNNESDKLIKERYKNAKKVEANFSYNSGDNNDFLNIEEIKNLIKENINNNTF